AHMLTWRHNHVRTAFSSFAAPAANLCQGGGIERGSEPMLIRRPSGIAPSEITPRGAYLRRREFLVGAASLGMIGFTSARAGAAPLQIVKPVMLEERVYRMRCVEGWSMVIPWVGFPLAEVLKRVEPQGSAKFVAFET